MRIKKQKNSPKRRASLKPMLEALRVALPYCGVGCLWIFHSNSFLKRYTADIDRLIPLSNTMGWLFVMMTTVLIYLIILRKVRQVKGYQDHLEEMVNERTEGLEKARKEAAESRDEKSRLIERMNHLTAFEAIIMSLAENFINVPIAEMEQALDESLGRIGRYLHEDMIQFLEFNYETKEALPLSAWKNASAASVRLTGRSYPFESFTELLESNSRGENHYISDTSAMDGSSPLRSVLQSQGIQSCIAIPVMANGKPLASISIGCLRPNKVWQEDDLAILKIFAEMITNVYERIRREEELLRNSKNLRTILDSAREHIFLVDKSGAVINVNNAVAVYSGMTVYEMIGKNLNDVFPDIMKTRGHMLQKAFESGQPEYYIGQFNNIWVESHYYPVFEPDGSVSAVAMFSTDITMRIHAEREIFESRQMLREIVENAPIGIYWRGEDGTILGFNRKAAEITMLSPEEMTGPRSCDRPARDLSTGLLDDNPQILASGVPKLHYEAIFINYTGESSIVNMSKVPLMNKEGKPYALLCVMEDITEQKKLLADLLQAQREASSASKAKGDFLSMMSHEIRTPLNSIIGLTHITRQSIDLRRIEEYLDKIDQSSKHLLGIINDILDISKIEAGKMTVTKSHFILESLLEEAIGLLQPRAEEKKQTISVSIGRNIPQTLVSDPLRLKQVLVNLLSNAVKFTPEHGMVDLKIAVVKRSDSRSLIEFAVQDNGIGISQEMMERLFTPFQQAERYQQGGAGLGLAISRNIVELLGGRIRVESQPGAGSIFSFTVPFEVGNPQSASRCAACPQPSHQEGRGSLTGRRIMVVEDMEINQMILREMLRDTGAEILPAADGKLALEAFEACGGGVDAILMDVLMPNMDGYATTRAIRMGGMPNAKTVPIIAMTANAYREDVEEALQAGMDDHIGKPFNYYDLLGRLLLHMKPRGEAVKMSSL